MTEFEPRPGNQRNAILYRHRPGLLKGVRLMDSGDNASNAVDPHRAYHRRSRLLRLTAWVAAGLTFVVILVLFAATVLVNTNGVHRYLLTLAQRKAGEALGVRVQLQNF